MSRMKLAVATAAVMVSVLAMPAASSAQTIDLPATCHSLLGSGTTDLAVVTIDRCYAAAGTTCTLTDTIDLLGLLRIRYGLCVDLATLTAERTATVVGVVKLRLLP